MAKFLISKSKYIRTKGWHLDKLMKVDSQNVGNAGVWGDDPGDDPDNDSGRCKRKKTGVIKSCLFLD